MLRCAGPWSGPRHIFPFMSRPHYALALTQMQLKNYEEAKILFKKVLELDPDYPQAETKLAQLEASF